MNKSIAILGAAILATFAGAASLTQLTAVLSLPGGGTGTNVVSYTHPSRHSIVAPVSAFAADTNGNIAVSYNTDAITNFVVGSFASGSLSLDLSKAPTIRYGESYTFTCSATNAATVLFNFEVSNP